MRTKPFRSRSNSKTRTPLRAPRRLVFEPLEHRQLFAVGVATPPTIDESATTPAAFSESTQAQAELKFSVFSGEELRQYLITDALRRYGDLFGKERVDYNFWPVVCFDAEPMTRFELASSYSDTNVQVAGVDESDLVETDGNYLFVAGNGGLKIFDARNPTSPRAVAEVSWGGRVVGEYLAGDRLAVLRYASDDHSSASCYCYRPRLTVTILDVADRESPKFVQETVLDDSLYTSRVIDNRLYLVMEQSQGMQLPRPEMTYLDTAEPSGSADDYYWHGRRAVYETQEQYLSRIAGKELDLALPDIWTRTADGGALASFSHDAERLVVSKDQDKNGSEWSWRPSYSIVSFDLTGSDPGPKSTTRFFAGYGATIYVSDKNIYVASPVSGTEESTRITAFRFDPKHGVEPTGEGIVPGYLINRFSIDEFNGHLRVATTAGWWQDAKNYLFVLQQHGEDLDIVGRLENLAPGEQIYSTRFLGDRAYLVTFVKTDPLFAIDLQSPTQPRVLGQLEITGFSQYLQSIGDGLLLGIGRNANIATGLYQDPQISLFDTADPAAQKLLDRFTIPLGRAGYTEAVDNCQAVSFFPDQGILAIPVSPNGGYCDSDGTTDLWVFRVSTSTDSTTGKRQGRIELLTKIDHSTGVTRSVRIGDVLFAISDSTISAYPLSDPTQTLFTLERGAAPGERPLLPTWRAAEPRQIIVSIATTPNLPESQSLDAAVSAESIPTDLAADQMQTPPHANDEALAQVQAEIPLHMTFGYIQNAKASPFDGIQLDGPFDTIGHA